MSSPPKVPLSPSRGQSRNTPIVAAYANREGFDRQNLTIRVRKFSSAGSVDEEEVLTPLTASGVRKPSMRRTKHGRPRIPSKEDLLDFTFGIPDSPMPGQGKSVTGRTRLRKKSSSSLADSMSESRSSPSISVDYLPSTPTNPRKAISSELPFPDALDVTTRHQVCNDSLKPWTYLLTIPGKNVRDMLIASFNKWIGCDEEQLILIKQIVAYLHSASLIVDDIEDESATRRGFPAAHTKFGVAPSLNAANYVYFLALEKLSTLQSTDAVTSFTNEMCNLHRGQGRDIFWRVTEHIASEAEYLHMVQDKTGGLFRLAIRVMHAAAALPSTKRKFDLDEDFAPAHLEELLHLSNDLASFFQIRDDLINLASPEFHKKKGFCEDITEGKLSFIALHSFRALTGTAKFTELMRILQAKTKDHATIRQALAIMHSTGSFEYCTRFLDDLRVRIERTIHILGGNDALLNVVRVLAADLDDCRDINSIIGNRT